MKYAKWFGRGVLVTVFGAIDLFGCNSDSEEPFDGNGGAPDASSAGGAPTGTGGSSGSASGSPGTGGAPGSIDAGALLECQARPPRDPAGTGAEGSVCCHLGMGLCTNPAQIQEQALVNAFAHDSCADGLECVPDPAAIAAARLAGVFEACAWDVGSRRLEGRCVPACFVQGHPAATFLEQTSCGDDLVCAPCFSPIDGQPTGACGIQEGDASTEPAPKPFVECGAPPADAPAGPPLGLCVPESLALAVDNAAIQSLERLECADGEVCAPALKVRDTGACFAPCESAIADVLGPSYGPGGCVPSYVVALVEPLAVGQLEQGPCAQGELCAPCLNPLAGDAPTGACQ